MVNAVAILVQRGVRSPPRSRSRSSRSATPAHAQLMYLVSENLWGVGGLFFGLWLIPMGWCVLRSGSMPRALGWVLIIGGVGYVLSAFVRYLVPGRVGAGRPAGDPGRPVGEFWMIGYLLIRGVDRRARADRQPTQRQNG